MITSTTPADWQELQEQVATILRECSFAVEVEKTVRTVRGETEIDVYAEETVKGRKYVILCECKHWKARVPQTVIHAFRTTMADVGANAGYVISSSGFQAGAFATSELTNLELVTWPEFQAKFEESWLEHFSTSVSKALGPLMSYTEPFFPKWFDELTEDDQKAFVALKEKHDALGYLAMQMSVYPRIVRKAPFPQLPLRAHYADKPEFLAELPAELLDIAGYRELYDALTRHSDAAIAKFRTYRERGMAATKPAESHD
jgi:restriction system protein